MTKSIQLLLAFGIIPLEILLNFLEILINFLTIDTLNPIIVQLSGRTKGYHLGSLERQKLTINFREFLQDDPVKFLLFTLVAFVCGKFPRLVGGMTLP